MPLIRLRRGASLAKELNPGQDHKDGPSKVFPGLLELACYSYLPKTLSYLQPDNQKAVADHHLPKTDLNGEDKI